MITSKEHWQTKESLCPSERESLYHAVREVRRSWDNDERLHRSREANRRIEELFRRLFDQRIRVG